MGTARRLEDDPALYHAWDLAAEYGIEVVDPDGWRNNRIPWTTPITHRQFIEMSSASTIQVTNFVKYKALFFHEPLPRNDERIR